MIIAEITPPHANNGIVDIIWMACLIVCFIKGKWRIAVIAIASVLVAVALAIWVYSTDQNTISPPVMFATMATFIGCLLFSWSVLVCAIRMAYPDSPWARRFYNEPNMALAKERFPHRVKDPNVIEGQIVAIEGHRQPLTLTDASRTLCRWLCLAVGWPIFVVGMILSWGAEILAIGIAIYWGRGKGFLVMMGCLIGAGAVLRFGSGALVALGGFLTGAFG
jgi:hypothetical protein